VAVSGATTAMMRETTRPGTPFEQPAQIDAIEGAQIVIVDGGGNDAKFGDVARLAIAPIETDPRGREAQIRAELATVSAPEFEQRLVGFYDDVASKVPEAIMVVVNYPDLLTEKRPGRPDSNLLTLHHLGYGDRFTLLTQYADTVNEQVDEATKLAAQRNSAGFIAVDVRDAFTGHELGSAEPHVHGADWVFGGNERLHPNAAGQQDLGRLIAGPLEEAVSLLELQAIAPPGTLVRPGLLEPIDGPTELGAGLPALDLPGEVGGLPAGADIGSGPEGLPALADPGLGVTGAFDPGPDYLEAPTWGTDWTDLASFDQLWNGSADGAAGIDYPGWVPSFWDSGTDYAGLDLGLDLGSGLPDLPDLGGYGDLSFSDPLTDFSLVMPWESEGFGDFGDFGELTLYSGDSYSSTTGYY
jgi:lysophospholipase L1-like esterase